MDHKIKLIKFILSLLLLNAPLTLQSQEVMISQDIVDEPGYEFVKVIGYEENGYYLLRSNLSLRSSRDKSGFKNRKFRLSFYDTDLRSQWTTDLLPFTKDANIDAVVFVNGRVLAITSLFDNSDRTMDIYLSWIDVNGQMEHPGRPRITFRLSKPYYDKARVTLSTSKNTLSIYIRENRDNQLQVIHTAAFDKELNPILSGQFKIPFSTKKYNIVDAAVSESGDIAILGLSTVKVKTKDLKRHTSYYLYVASIEDSAFIKYPIGHALNVKGLGMEFDNYNNSLVLTGFHTDVSSTTGASIIYDNFDFRSGEKPNPTSFQVNANQNIKLAGERNTGSGMGLVNYPIERIIVRQDGGAVIIAEGSYSSEYSYYDYFTQSYTRTIEYIFGNIVVFSVSNEGKIDWSSVIEKTQISVNDGGSLSSFSHILNSEEMATAFNTSISRKNQVLSVKVDKYGTQFDATVLTKLDGMLLVPTAGRQVSATELVVPAYNRKKLFLTKIDFD